MLRYIITSVAISIVFCLLIASCDSESSEIEDPSWKTDSYGRFHTENIERAQREIPFDIIAPDYLPKNIIDPPHIVGPTKGSSWFPGDDENKVSVILTYGAGDNNTEGLLIIEENNWMAPPDPTINEGYEPLVINGTEVVECEHTYSSPVSTGFINHEGYIFGWRHQSIYYEVSIYHYTKEEAIRVVESMIQQ